MLNADYRLANAGDGTISVTRANTTYAWWIPVLIAVDVVVVGACAAWVLLSLRKNNQNLVDESSIN